MKSWTETKACQSRAFCRECRTNSEFRQTIMNNGRATERDFACPHGMDKMGLGDIVALAATPIARALKLPCIDPATKELRPESRCAKWKKGLNALTRKA